jgi:peptide/nickel transport system permease protein
MQGRLLSSPFWVLRFATRLTVGLLLGGFLSLLLVRCAPGFGVDERDLDPTLSESSHKAIHAPADKSSMWSAYAGRVQAAMHGDLGYSESLNAPVSQLIAERGWLTARSVAWGLALAWVLGLPLAVTSVLSRGSNVVLLPASTLLLCLPLGLVAIYFFLFGLPTIGVVAAGVAPKRFMYTRQLLIESERRPHVFGAVARGVGFWRLFCFHRAFPVLPELLSLFGVSITIALGAAIPAEALCDSPGLGQLAWKASVARDTAPLLAITWLLTAIAFSANALSGSLDRAARTWRE